MDHVIKSRSRKTHTVRVNTPVIDPNANTVAYKEPVIPKKKTVAHMGESIIDRLLRATRDKLLGLK